MFNTNVKLALSAIFTSALLMAAGLGVLALSSTKADAADFTLCNDLSEAVAAAATARDAGYTAGAVFNLGLEAGLDADMIAAIINLVFVEMKYDSPSQIQSTFMAHCLAN